MKWFNAAKCVCFHNFKKWTSNYRVWIIAILTVIFVHYFTDEIRLFTDSTGLLIAPWIFPFLFGQKYVKLIFFLPLILLFCDAPFIDSNQPYMIARSGRTAWSVGQIAYIFFASGAYFLFLFISTVVINLPHTEFTMGWGKAIGTLSNTTASSQLGIKILFSSRITHYFTPLQAVWFTLLLSWLVGFVLGLLIYAVNSLSGTRSIGMLAAAFLLVLDATVFATPQALWFSPVSWCSIGRIDIGGMTDYPPIWYIYLMLGLLIVVLSVFAIWINRKQNIEILPPI